MSHLAIETFLQQPEEVSKLNQWIFENIQPYVKGKTMEMHSGSGVFSSLLIEQGTRLHLSDLDKPNRDRLREKFNGRHELRTVNKIDYHHHDFKQCYAPLLDIFSTVVAVNFAEQGFLSRIELDNGKLLLRKGGHLIVALPSFTALFPGLEQDLEDLKMYNRKPLKKFLGDFQILKVRYFRLEANTHPSLPAHSGLSSIVVARKIG